VELSIPHELPPVRFDSDAVSQIVENLLDNAEKHTRSADNRAIQVSLTPANGVVALSVSDHGPGLPDNVRRHLFQAFERGNNADAPAGLGLGLVLVQALARAQGGDVTYTDSPGGGARFTVTFPG
jgi:signal transduction histidine kinase